MLALEGIAHVFVVGQQTRQVVRLEVGQDFLGIGLGGINVGHNAQCPLPVASLDDGETAAQGGGGDFVKGYLAAVRRSNANVVEVTQRPPFLVRVPDDHFHVIPAPLQAQRLGPEKALIHLPGKVRQGYAQHPSGGLQGKLDFHLAGTKVVADVQHAGISTQFRLQPCRSLAHLREVIPHKAHFDGLAHRKDVFAHEYELQGVRHVA